MVDSKDWFSVKFEKGAYTKGVNTGDVELTLKFRYGPV